MRYISILLLLFTFTVHASVVINGPANQPNSADAVLPSQTGKSGKVLGTNGTTASWTTVAGTGDVVGPASSTDGGFAKFDGTTGKLLKNSAAAVADADLALSYIKADGTRALTGSWNVGAFNITASTFIGALTGNASTATTATNATNTAVTDDTSTNATMYPTWVTTTTGNLPQKLSSTKMTFNPSTGMLTTTGYTGAHTGRVNSTQVVETVVAGGTCSTTYTVDPTTGTMFNVTLNGACQFAVTNLAAGHSFTIKMTQSSTTAPTFAAAYKWALATAPTWSATSTKYDIVSCASFDGTTLNCSGIVDVR